MQACDALLRATRPTPKCADEEQSRISAAAAAQKGKKLSKKWRHASLGDSRNYQCLTHAGIFAGLYICIYDGSCYRLPRRNAETALGLLLAG